jgi:hypothetical protein
VRGVTPLDHGRWRKIEQERQLGHRTLEDAHESRARRIRRRNLAVEDHSPPADELTQQPEVREVRRRDPSVRDLVEGADGDHAAGETTKRRIRRRLVHPPTDLAQPLRVATDETRELVADEHDGHPLDLPRRIDHVDLRDAERIEHVRGRQSDVVRGLQEQARGSRVQQHGGPAMVPSRR